MSKLKLLWVTDPWNTLDHSQDTTLRLAEEALNLGLASYWSGADVILKSSSSLLNVIPLTHDLIKNIKLLPLSSFEELKPSNFHHLHYRIDPPVDLNYISLLDELIKRGVKKSQILNSPDLITSQSEKTPPSSLSKLSPVFRVIRSPKDTQDAYEVFKSYRELVTKPLNLAQSIGVKKWAMPHSCLNFEKLIEIETKDYTTPILVEEFLPEVMKGETRMWFANGEFIAALKKFPASGDFRVLIDQGSRIEPHTLTENEKASALQVGAVLKSQGAAMAAIDFIGGKISDYNITSPGLLVQMEEAHGGKNFAKMILEKIYF
jgi:glutathione synthase